MSIVLLVSGIVICLWIAAEEWLDVFEDKRHTARVEARAVQRYGKGASGDGYGSEGAYVSRAG